MKSRRITCTAPLALLCMTALVLTATADEQHFWVDANNGSDASGDGSEENPWRTITTALSETEGTQSDPVVIYAKQGTYQKYMPDGEGESFPIKPRDYDTIIGSGKTSCNVSGDGNHSVFKFVDVSSGARIEGMTIRDGSNVNGGGIYSENSKFEMILCAVSYNYVTGEQYTQCEEWGCGAGLYCIGSSPYILYCEFWHNETKRYGWGGGGIYCGANSNPTIETCIFSDNKGRRGAAICCGSSSPTIKGCTIEENHAFKYAGGIWCYKSSSPRIEATTIDGNESEECAGGLCCFLHSSPYVIGCSINGNELTTGQFFYGGGVSLFDGSSPVFINCEIHANTGASAGGAISMDDRSSPTIRNTNMDWNEADRSGTLMKGGAVFCRDRCNPTVRGCTMVHNSGRFGGAIFVSEASSPQITLCTIALNTATGAGGAIMFDGRTAGGAIGGDARIENCIIAGNQSEEEGAGGIYCYYDASPTIRNSLVYNNESAATGEDGAGGISCESGSSPKVVNCTIHLNTSGGVSADTSSEPELTNCILWSNGDDVYGIECTRISHCDIEDGNCEGENGNIAADPIFVTKSGCEHYECTHYLSEDEIDGQNYDSPCIDAGDNQASEYGLHVKTTRTDDEYDAGLVDMGYHYVSDKNVFYVNEDTGDDDWDGRAPTYQGYDVGPWKRITESLERTEGRGQEDNPVTIYVAAGLYDIEHNNEEFSLKPDSYTSLIGEGCDRTVIDGHEDGNNTIVVLEVYQKQHVSIEGFMITGGNCVQGTGCGGGIRCTESSHLVVDGCDILKNTAKFGGGVYYAESTSNRIVNSTVRENEAIKIGSDGGVGGGILCRNYTPVIVFNSQLLENTADAEGGGAAMCNSSSIELLQCTVRGNQAESGGGVYTYYLSHPVVFNSSVIYNTATDGGAVCCTEDCDPDFMHSVLFQNRADQCGGAIYCHDHCDIALNGFVEVIENSAGDRGGGIFCDQDCSRAGQKPWILNNVIAKNVAEGEGECGGGIHLENNSNPPIVNCTIDGNSPSGICCLSGSQPSLLNCILWNNGDDLAGDSYSCSYIMYCDIEDGDCPESEGYEGNFSKDPLFVPLYDDGSYVGYYIAHEGAQGKDSPCKDAGDRPSNDEDLDLYPWTTCTDERKDDGIVDLGYHYKHGYQGGYNTYIMLASFEATATGKSILVTWETATEINNAGFNLYRVEPGDQATHTKVNERLIPAQGSLSGGASYEFLDADVRPGINYDYYLVDIDTSGKETVHGPASARIPQRLIDLPQRRETGPSTRPASDGQPRDAISACAGFAGG